MRRLLRFARSLFNHIAAILARRTARRTGRSIAIFHISLPLHEHFVHNMLIALRNSRFVLPLLAFNHPNVAKTFTLGGFRRMSSLDLLPRFNNTWLVTEDTGWYPIFEGLKVVHVMHSMASTLVIYPEDVFDRFSCIFCSGPHHQEELMALLRKRKRHGIMLVKTGSEIIDGLMHAPAPEERERPHILFAPTWGNQNALRLFGMDILALLLPHYKVTLRPHPLSFREDVQTLNMILERLGRHPDFTLDRSPDPIGVMSRSDLMISDWSGSALEFALGRLRPVLFLDVPMKERNPRWREILTRPGAEACYRERLGCIEKEPAGVPGAIETLWKDRDRWAEEIKARRPELVYHPGRSGEIAARALEDIVSGRTPGGAVLT